MFQVSGRAAQLDEWTGSTGSWAPLAGGATVTLSLGLVERYLRTSQNASVDHGVDNSSDWCTPG